MKPVSYRCHRFPPQIIQHAIWLYCRFTLSFRDADDVMAKQGEPGSAKPEALSEQQAR